MTEFITLQKILIEIYDNSDVCQTVFFLAHCALKRRFSSQNNPESGKKLFKYQSPVQTRETAYSTQCLFPASLTWYLMPWYLLPQFCLPLGLSSRDYLCTSFELLGITLACPCFPLGGPKFYYLTPSGCCASLSLSRFS